MFADGAEGALQCLPVESIRRRSCAFSPASVAPLAISGPRGVACIQTSSHKVVLFDMQEDEEDDEADDEDDEREEDIN